MLMYKAPSELTTLKCCPSTVMERLPEPVLKSTTPVAGTVRVFEPAVTVSVIDISAVWRPSVFTAAVSTAWPGDAVPGLAEPGEGVE